MIEFNAIALLRRRAATSCQLPLAEGQRFLEMRESDKARLVQAYRANGMSGKPERLQRRYDHGMRCFAIEEGERLVAWFWALHGVPRYMDEFAWQIPLNETQVWLRDAFVVPERRGRRLLLAMMGAEVTVESTPMEYFSDVSVSNRPSLRAHAAMGFSRFATVHSLRFGGSRWWRSLPPEGLPAPAQLRPDQKHLRMSADEIAWHHAQIA